MLHTDLYQITMAAGYFARGIHNQRVTFRVTYRKAPFGGTGVIAYGISDAIAEVSHVPARRINRLNYLETLKGSDGEPLFTDEFIEWLQCLPDAPGALCEYRGVPDGSLVFPHEPILEVTGPLWAVQWIETHLLHSINAASLLATKARRVVMAADGDPVLELGYRRAQNPMLATQAAWVGGVSATSNVEAGYLYGIPVKGTHAHSWVMQEGGPAEEQRAFDEYARALPNNVTLLIDTFNTVKGVEKAIKTFKSGVCRGTMAIRLDSGDLCALSKTARKMLDEAGLPEVKIVASNDLDEHKIRALKSQGAKIDVWGGGTQMVVAADQPALGGVYKLTQVCDPVTGQWSGRIKKSEDAIKASDPGAITAYHVYNDGKIVASLLSFDPNLATADTLPKCFTRSGMEFTMPEGYRLSPQTVNLPHRFTLADARANAQQVKLPDVCPNLLYTEDVYAEKTRLNQ